MNSVQGAAAVHSSAACEASGAACSVSALASPAPISASASAAIVIRNRISKTLFRQTLRRTISTAGAQA